MGRIRWVNRAVGIRVGVCVADSFSEGVAVGGSDTGAVGFPVPSLEGSTDTVGVLNATDVDGEPAAKAVRDAG